LNWNTRSYLYLAPFLFLGIYYFAPHRSEPQFFPRLEESPPSQTTLEKKLKKSQELYSKNANDLASLVDQGVAYFFMGKETYAQSLNSFNLAWRQGAFDKRIFYYSGVLYENLSLLEEAQKQYERFLKHEPKERQIRLRLARLLWKMQKWNEAILKYQELLKEDPKDITSLVNCGLAFQKNAELLLKKKKLTQEEKVQLDSFLTQAISNLESASLLETSSPGHLLTKEVSLTLLQLYKAHQDWEKAVSFSLNLLKKFPEEQELFLILGSSYEALGRQEDAFQIYSKALEKVPKNPFLNQKVRTLKKKLKKR